MIWCGDEAVGVIGKRLGPDIEIAGRAAHDANVDLTLSQQFDELVAISDLNHHLNSRVVFTKLREELWNKILRGAHQPMVRLPVSIPLSFAIMSSASRRLCKTRRA